MHAVRKRPTEDVPAWRRRIRHLQDGSSLTWGIAGTALFVAVFAGFHRINAQGTCDLWADTPAVQVSRSGGSISGTGHRECAGSGAAAVGVTVRVKQDRTFWFDKKLAARSDNATPNIELGAVYPCKGRGSIKVYTEIVAGNRKEQSARKKTSLCS